MEYSAAETVEMTMAPKILTDREVYEVVKQSRDGDNLRWAQIASKLQKMGHVSRKTGKPLTQATVRHYYYYWQGKDSNAQGRGMGQVIQLKPGTSDADRKIKLVEGILSSDTKDLEKLKLITMVLRG